MMTWAYIDELRLQQMDIDIKVNLSANTRVHPKRESIFPEHRLLKSYQEHGSLKPSYQFRPLSTWVVLIPSGVLDIKSSWVDFMQEHQKSELLFPRPRTVKVVERRVNVDTWIAAINASDEEVKHWLESLLQDYNITPNEDNLYMLSSIIKLWIKREFSKEGLEISDNDLQKVFKFITKIAYDTIC